jgi:hypothetical protein
MDRLILTLVIVVVFLVCLGGMWLGWRRKARSQSVRVPPFPDLPDELGELVLAEATGLYVSTTTAGHWQDRIVTRSAGLRGNATLRLYAGGIEVDRSGAPSFWIPAASLVDAHRDKAIAGKVMGSDSLLIITWKAGETLLDTGFRGDDLDVYPQWIEEVRTAASPRWAANDTSDLRGGAQ